MSNPDTNETLQKGIRAARRGHNEPARRLLAQVTQADPQNETAWLWLSRVTEEPQQRAQALQQVLALNPQNRWAAEQLEALQTASEPAPAPTAEEATTAEAPGLPQQQFGELKLEMISCPNCGGTVSIHGQNVKTVVCQSCNSVVDLTAEQAAVIDTMKRRPKPAQPIELGMEGTFGRQKHQVIGWLRYKGWDDEDTWYWDEWLLASEKGEYRWLSYDSEDGFIFYRQLPIKEGFDPRNARLIPVPGGSAVVTERAPAKITALNGELTWRARVGEQLRYIDAQGDGKQYSVEYSQDEIELLEGISLSAERVWQAFGREDLVERAQAAASARRHSRVLALIAAIFAVVGGLAIMCAAISGNGIMEQTVTLDSSAPVQQLGPIEITSVGRPHELRLRVNSLPVNSWAIVSVTALDDRENEYYLFAAEFWDEEGRDSDGYWHETDYEGSYLFKPENQGSYRLNVELEEADTEVSSVQVRVMLEESVWLSRYFIAFVVLCGLFAYFFFSRAQR